MDNQSDIDRPIPAKRSWAEAFKLYWSAKESLLAKALFRRVIVVLTGVLGVAGIADEFIGGWILGPVDDIPWLLLLAFVIWRVNTYRTKNVR